MTLPPLLFAVPLVAHKLFHKMSLCLCYSVVWLLVDDPAVKTEGFWEREMFSQLAKRSMWKAVFTKAKEKTIDREIGVFSVKENSLHRSRFSIRSTRHLKHIALVKTCEMC